MDTRHERIDTPGRNDPCSCGSGKKYKQCCAQHVTSPKSARVPADPQGVRQAIERAAVATATEAFSVLDQALTRHRDSASLHVAIGKLFLDAGRPQDAVSRFDRAVSLAPASASARIQQGLALEQLGWHAEATETYRRAIEVAPRLAEAHARLGIVLLVQELRAEAAQSFRRASTLEPRTPIGRTSGAYALLAEGRADEAQAALQRIVEIEPDNASAHAELGKLLAEAGRADEAWAAFEQVVRLDPRAAGHYYDLVRIRRMTEADRPLLERMLAAARRDDLPSLHRSMLELAIGKACDDLGEADRAMPHYVEANRIKGRLRPLDRKLVSSRVDWQVATFTRDYFERIATHRSTDTTPLLVLGMPRSGTTLVESILARHSAVGAGQELSFWGRRAQDLMLERQPPDGPALRDVASDYLKVLRDISPAARVTDKKPDNFFWAGLVHATFPAARIVHCRRHPLDTCTSIVANFFAPRPDFSGVSEDLVFYYREYERMMAHWIDVLPADRLFTLDYEALVADPNPSSGSSSTFADCPGKTLACDPRKVDVASTLRACGRSGNPSSADRWVVGDAMKKCSATCARCSPRPKRRPGRRSMRDE